MGILRPIIIPLIILLSVSLVEAAPSCSGTGKEGDPRICLPKDSNSNDSCASADIVAAVKAANTYDYAQVTLPGCIAGRSSDPLDVSATWPAGTNINLDTGTSKDFRIIGQGIYVNNRGVQRGTRIVVTPTLGYSNEIDINYAVPAGHGAGLKEVASFTVDGALLSIYLCKGATNVRIHHMGFLHSISMAALKIHENLYEAPGSVCLIDHCHFSSGPTDKVKHTTWYALHIYGGNNEAQWVSPISTFGANTGVYVEDCDDGKEDDGVTDIPSTGTPEQIRRYNTTHDAQCPEGGCYGFDGTYHPITSSGSARYTARYNTFRHFGAGMDAHGPSYQFGTAYCDQAGASAPCYQGAYRIEVYNNIYYGGTTLGSAGYANYDRGGHWIITDNKYVNCNSYDGVITVEMDAGSVGTNCNTASNCPGTPGSGIDVKDWAGVSCNATPGCWESPHATYVWNNTFVNCSSAGSNCRNNGNANNLHCVRINDAGTGCIRTGKELFGRAPQSGDPEVTTYTKYQYPHPLQKGAGIGAGPLSAPRGVRVIK